MIKVISVETTRRVEQAADAAGISYATMMENAGAAVAERVLRVLQERMLDEARVTVLVGPGNNGGDGLVAARLIAERSNAQVRCYLLKPRDASDAHFAAVQDAGLFVATAPDDQRHRVLFNLVASAHVVVDALFGVGVRLPIAGDAARVLRQAAAALNEAREPELGSVTIAARPDLSPVAQEPYVLAVDCPSGLDCDTGALDPAALRADETVTFIGAKPGQLVFPGAGAVGQLGVSPIGIPADVAALDDEPRFLVDAATVRSLVPPRSPGAHKGTFGKALVVAGSVNYTGAPALAAEAACRAGAGLVTVAAPAPVASAVGAHLPEATYILLPHDLGVIAEEAARIVREEAARYDALLIGPGIGREATTGEMLARLLGGRREGHAGRRVIGFGVSGAESASEEEAVSVPPLVIDADGLFLLGQIQGWPALLPPDTVLTPHPGEMATLVGMTVEEIQADRWGVAAAKAREWNVVLVLKGAHTLIAEPGGRVAALPFKTAALATAGTGDVLAGMIAGLRAQGASGFDAAVAAGYLHGLAGQLMAEQVGTRGTLAGDVVHYGLPQALRLLGVG